MVEREEVGLEELSLEGYRRYENSILADVPRGLAEKGVLATTLFMYYMDGESENEWTGRKTFMNVEESYIASGVYPESHLSKVYESYEEMVVVRRRDGTTVEEYETRYKILDKKEDKRIRAEALRYWQTNGLATYFEEVAIAKIGGIQAEKLLQNLIISKALRDGDDQTFYVNKAIDILGMKVKDKKVEINLRKLGGQEIIEATSKQPGAGFLGAVDFLESDD